MKGTTPAIYLLKNYHTIPTNADELTAYIENIRQSLNSVKTAVIAEDPDWWRVTEERASILIFMRAFLSLPGFYYSDAVRYITLLSDNDTVGECTDEFQKLMAVNSPVLFAIHSEILAAVFEMVFTPSIRGSRGHFPFKNIPRMKKEDGNFYTMCGGHMDPEGVKAERIKALLNYWFKVDTKFRKWAFKLGILNCIVGFGKEGSNKVYKFEIDLKRLYQFVRPIEFTKNSEDEHLYRMYSNFGHTGYIEPDGTCVALYELYRSSLYHKMIFPEQSPVESVEG